MPRSSTTALYTRVDNSFSNPVVGTTINPTHADTFFDDVEAAVNAFLATSASSVAIGTGAKTFTVASGVADKVFIAGTFVHIYSRADTADYMYGSVTSYSTSTGDLVVDVTVTGGTGTNTDWNIYQAGARGATGATGATGPTSGIRQAYSTTTADADPGAGIFRLNNATPASATAAYLDNADAGGATVSTLFDLFDDSTSTTKGFIRFEKASDPTVWAQFAVTGSVVDGTGYRKLTLTSGAGSGAFTDTDTFSITFFRAGDKGADGAGTGDVVGPASATDGHVVLFDSTTGKLIKSANAGPITQGLHTIGVASGGIFPATTNGCAALAQAETTTNKINYKYLAFDASAVEYAWLWFPTPKSYNAGTFTARFVWTHPSTTTNFGVVWQAEMLAVANDDALDTAVGTAVTVTDTGGTTQDFYTSDATGAITPSNTAAKQDWMAVRVSRLATNGSDTMAVDAHLVGVEIYITLDAATDT